MIKLCVLCAFALLEQTTPDWWARIPNILVAVGTLALAVIGAIAAKIALGTLDKIREQTEHAKTAAEAARDSANLAIHSAEFSELATKNSQRADVLLESASIVYSRPGVFDVDASLDLKFKNFGRTRANDLTFRVLIIIPGMQPQQAPPMPKMVLGPGQEQGVSFPRFGSFLTMRTWQEIAAGHLSMKFESWLVYGDVFGSSYTTGDFGTYDHTTGRFRIEENTAG